MRRRLALALLILPLLGLTWAAQRIDPVPIDARMQVEDVGAQVSAAERKALGPLQLAGMWRLTGADRRFGGYSALVARPGGLRAVSDRNRSLLIDLPLQAGSRLAPIPRMLALVGPDGRHVGFDIESVVKDVDGALWIGLEDEWHVARADTRLGKARFFGVPELRKWPRNGGVEAMTRLTDGRWIMLCESCDGPQRGLHLGLVFDGRPGLTRARPFGIAIPSGFDPVDAATLPDGRVLLLVRRLVLLPLHFEARIVVADFKALDASRPVPTHEVARLDGPFIRENWEGMAVLSNGPDLILWLVSDANDSAFQETRLLQLRFDPARLDPARLDPARMPR